MSNPQAEAIDILSSVLEELLKGSSDIKSTLRRGAHACQILKWNQQLSWFQNELNGYPSDAELPRYRTSVKGRIEWKVVAGLHAIVSSMVQDEYSTTKEPVRQIEMDVRQGTDWLLSAAQWGCSEPTGNKSSKYISYDRKSVETEERNIYDKHVFQTIITNIENAVFNFASNSYAILRYGDALQDVWQAYRATVEERLIPIGFSKYLDAIRNGLNSNNPQEWRKVMWSCRDILHDLAAYLWRDGRETYEHLPGQGKNGKLGVTEGEYVNRLGAYLHQKAITGQAGIYLRAEMERIYHSISTLNQLDSKAHGEITLLDVRTAAIGTYIILGEIATRTDMRPVTEYCNPEVSAA